jgi:hypothetical protein
MLQMITSFVVSLSLTVAAVIAAFFKRGLPPDRFDAVDLLVLGSLKPSSLTTSVRTAIRNASMMSMKRKRRIEAFESFILTMSDGHLVTGFSVVLSATFLLAGVQSWDSKTSVWTFQVAAMLGYFSFVVHLCSLTVTRQYFDNRHPGLRHIRTLLIGLFLVFECVILVYQ